MRVYEYKLIIKTYTFQFISLYILINLKILPLYVYYIIIPCYFNITFNI